MKPLDELIKEMLGVAEECIAIEDALEQDPLDTEAARTAKDLLRNYLNDMASYLEACIHLLKTEKQWEVSVEEKLKEVREFSYGSSRQIVKECFDQMEACKQREEKEVKQAEFINEFMKKVFDRLKKFTDLLHTYSHPSELHPDRQVTLETYNAVIGSVRRVWEKTVQISDRVKSLTEMQKKTEEYIEQSRQTLEEYFRLLQRGCKDSDLFRQAHRNIELALKGDAKKSGR